VQNDLKPAIAEAKLEKHHGSSGRVVKKYLKLSAFETKPWYFQSRKTEISCTNDISFEAAMSFDR
jgi:hypothetical protein